MFESVQELENKIKSLKTQQNPAKEKFGVQRMNFSHLLIDLSSGLIVGAALGYIIDWYLEKLPLFFFIFTILGTAAGFYNSYKELKNLEKDNNDHA